MTKRPYTDEEKQYIRENYHTLGYEAIARELNRQGPSVRGMASKLGVSKKKSKAKFCYSSGPEKKRCPHCGKAVSHD